MDLDQRLVPRTVATSTKISDRLAASNSERMFGWSRIHPIRSIRIECNSIRAEIESTSARRGAPSLHEDFLDCHVATHLQQSLLCASSDGFSRPPSKSTHSECHHGVKITLHSSIAKHPYDAPSRLITSLCCFDSQIIANLIGSGDYINIFAPSPFKDFFSNRRWSFYRGRCRPYALIWICQAYGDCHDTAVA